METKSTGSRLTKDELAVTPFVRHIYFGLNIEYSINLLTQYLNLVSDVRGTCLQLQTPCPRVWGLKCGVKAHSSETCKLLFERGRSYVVSLFIQGYQAFKDVYPVMANLHPLHSTLG
jgi:hypothetical protein